MTLASEPHPTTGQPVGLPVDEAPAKPPGPVTLEGRYGRVERLGSRHAAQLWQAYAGHDHIWTYMSAYGPFIDAGQFSQWFASRLTLDDPYSYAIVDPTGQALGIATLMEIRPAMRVIEVGHIVYSPALQRRPLGTEAQYLLARYAFETLGYRRYEWKCNALNAASRQAALRYGFVYEGTLRQYLIAKGRNRDNAWFSMLDSEWPARKAAFERWLAPENFDRDGRQRTSLRALNAAAHRSPHRTP
jgi:RimJ/RimL family protein N-acetyltransferase